MDTITKFELFKDQAAYYYGQARTALAALAGLLATLLATGLLPAQYEHIAQAVLALATALGVYVVKDDPSPKQADAHFADGYEVGRQDAA